MVNVYINIELLSLFGHTLHMIASDERNPEDMFDINPSIKLQNKTNCGPNVHCPFHYINT